jgi:hypothetical protein
MDNFISCFFASGFRYWCPTSEHKANPSCDQCSQQPSSPPRTASHQEVQRSTAEPIILLLKELPTNCSTIVVTCQPDVADSDSDICNTRRKIRSVMMSGGRFNTSGRRRMSLIGSSRSSSACFGPVVIRPSGHCDMCSNESEQLQSLSEDHLILKPSSHDSLLLFYNPGTTNSVARSRITGDDASQMVIPSAPPPSYSSVCVGSWSSAEKSYSEQPSTVSESLSIV